ncbi:S9 family peptidase [halophilic archaeon]|nr:S9 family peptidase [halophilic archaeon]
MTDETPRDGSTDGSTDPPTDDSRDRRTGDTDRSQGARNDDARAGTAFPLEDLIRLPDYYNPVVSPDGERIAFYYDETGRVELYVQDLRTGERERISDGNVPRDARYPLAWSRDGECIFFHEDDDGDEQNDIHAMTLDGEREPLVTHEGQCVLEDVDPGGRYLLFTSTAGEQKNLYRYDLERGESEQLTDYDRPVWDAIYGPDGERIAYRTNEADDLENRDVYVADADGSNPRNLNVGETGAEAGMSDWRGDRLLVDDNSADLGRVGVYDLGTDEVTWYGPGDHEEYAVRFTPDGDVLAMRTRECAILPVRYDDPDGDGEEFDLPEGVAAPVGTGTSRVVTDDGRVVTSFGTAAGRQRLVAYDLASGDHEPLVEAEYGDFDPAAFADAEYVTYESHDSTEIDGLLYDSGERPSPALVMVHGGPHAQTLRRFNPFVQYLVAQGYSVFAPNYRGSTGKGREFKNAVHGDWGGDEQGDVAEAGRWLKGRDWVDDDRVAVFGGSYGGYSTYCQLTTYPELWATGVAIVGMTDLRRLYEESMPHFKTILEQHLGDPEANADLYRERSPVTHVEDMERPIGILHGVNDPRCPVSQARLFRDALEDVGWTEGEDGDFEYYELGEEGHGSTDTERRIRQYRILVDYIERRL